MFVEKRFFATSVAYSCCKQTYVESFPDFKVQYRNKRASSDHNKENSHSSMSYGYLRRERLFLLLYH